MSKNVKLQNLRPIQHVISNVPDSVLDQDARFWITVFEDYEQKRIPVKAQMARFAEVPCFCSELSDNAQDGCLSCYGKRASESFLALVEDRYYV